MKSKQNIINKSFGERMEFGTAGIRGILGAGTNKINVRTIGAAAQAYAEYLIKHVPNAKKQGIVIGHDNRHN
jgi:phosphomannomutase